MSKKHFIQQIIIRSAPKIEKMPEAIRYAEKVWDALSAKGYGEAKHQKQKENIDYYQQLSAEKRQGFDRFWNAFKHKHGRNGAAMRWGQLEVQTPQQYQHIIQAAQAEALRQLGQGQSRKMAQGWLEEKRYLDYTAPSQRANKEKPQKHINTLIGELNSVKRLYETGGNEALLKQIHTLEQAINDERP